MLDWLRRWRSNREAWAAGAKALIALDERQAYYEAHRRAAPARKIGDAQGFLHWTKVAAEVARLSPVAEMNMAEVQRIVDFELATDGNHKLT